MTVRRAALVLPLPIVFVWFLGSVSLSPTTQPSTEEVHVSTRVALVDGEPISVSEFLRALERTRRGNASRQSACQVAIRVAVRRKVEQIIMKETGVQKDISYVGFLEGLRSENERRQRMRASGGRIYGPETYGEREYFEHVFLSNVIQVKKLIQRKSNGAALNSTDLLPKETDEHYSALVDQRVREADVVIDANPFCAA
jgi:hypothetical protein